MKIIPPITLFAAALLLGGCATGGAEAPTPTPTSAATVTPSSAPTTASASPTSTPTPAKTKTATTTAPVDDIDAEEIAAGAGAGAVEERGAYPGCPDKVTNLGRPVPIICGKSVSDMSPAEYRRKHREIVLWAQAVANNHVDEWSRKELERGEITEDQYWDQAAPDEEAPADWEVDPEG